MQSADPKGRHPAKEAAETYPDDPSTDEIPPGQEPRGVQEGIADADKKARTGSTDELVRNTPPAGAWNDTSAD